ncbi:MAG: hypothetical protein LBG84_06265 [Treponema sp.]|jgi:hypothetical protein|nr:hypothetical protein [Treponema sp.]
MAWKTDLYSILYSYAKKIKSPRVDVNEFTGFLERYASQERGERPEWNKWLDNTAAKIWREAEKLEETGAILVLDRDKAPRFLIQDYYVQLIQEFYDSPNYDVNFPFPNEEALGLKIPDDLLICVGTKELPELLRSGELDRPMVKILFPSGYGEAVVLASWLPLKVLEICFFKIRIHLLRQGNKDYLRQKLLSQFTGREELLRDMLNQLVSRPLDCVNDLIDGREISFYFWAFFGGLIKIEHDRPDLLQEEISTLQAVHLLEMFNVYFKTRAAKKKEVDFAFKNLELELDNPPYYFSRAAIEEFTDSKGVSLLGQYSEEQLDEYLRKRTGSAEPDRLPDMLYFRAQNKSWLIKKNKMLPLTVRLLGEERASVIDFLSARWREIIVNWRSEPAMENDKELEKVIWSYIRESSPILAALLGDHRLYLIYDEIRRFEKTLPDSSRLFVGTELQALRSLFFIKRKELVSEVRLRLPFWYSTPFLSRIIAFFVNLGKPPVSSGAEKSPVRPAKTEDLKIKLKNSAWEAKARLIPEGSSPEDYLGRLAARWSRLITKQPQDSLVKDVNTLVRSKLNYMLHFQKITNVKENTLDMMSESIVKTSPELHKIHDQAALLLYIKLYIIQILGER